MCDVRKGPEAVPSVLSDTAEVAGIYAFLYSHFCDPLFPYQQNGFIRISLSLRISQELREKLLKTFILEVPQMMEDSSCVQGVIVTLLP